MATVLENYYGYRQQLLQRMAQPPISPADLCSTVRSCIESAFWKPCQMYLRSAPITREVPCLQGHYMMLECLRSEPGQRAALWPEPGPPIRRKSGMRLRSIWSG